MADNDKTSGNPYKTANDVACWDCEANATAHIEEMFVDLIQRERIARGQKPALRTVFLKQDNYMKGTYLAEITQQVTHNSTSQQEH